MQQFRNTLMYYGMQSQELVTAKAYTKGLITNEVQETIFSENGTSERRKPDKST